jgi:sodium/hydrogen exchanger 8
LFHAHRFLDNIGAICTFAFIGTFISTMSIGFIMWLGGKLGMSYGLTFMEATLFGAIVSATDPVTVLSVFQRLGANADLYSLVFGESVLNDAVAIVLYRTFMSFIGPDDGSATVGSGILSFFVIFIGSMLCGEASRFWCCSFIDFQAAFTYLCLAFVTVGLMAFLLCI